MMLGLEKGKVEEVTMAWQVYSSVLGSPQFEMEGFAQSVGVLCGHGLQPLVTFHFLHSLQLSFKEQHASTFWNHFEEFVSLKKQANDQTKKWKKVYHWIQSTLPKALRNICAAKSSQEESLKILCHAAVGSSGIALSRVAIDAETSKMESCLFRKYQTSITALLLTSVPKHFSEILYLYFKSRLEEFSKIVKRCGSEVDEESELNDNDDGEVFDGETSEGDGKSSCSSRGASVEDMDINGGESKDTTEIMEGIVYSSKEGFDTLPWIAEVAGPSWVKEIHSVVECLRELGFDAISEEAYASAIYSLLKVKIHSVASKHYEKPVLASIRKWIKAVPLGFLQVVLMPDGPRGEENLVSSSPSPLASSSSLTLGGKSTERVARWHLRLEYFAYETLGDLRTDELFDIIVDYPESLAAIEDLRQCLANTGRHARLIESFRTALHHRLLTAGAATTDIILQYVSTIKALRTTDPSGVLLEAVGDPIREYLRGRKDTIRCIVTMLTEDSGAGSATSVGGSGGESLLEELSKGPAALDNADSEDDGVADDDEAWAAAENWEPDPIEADPSRTSKSRRSMDIIGMLVGIYGSKELFVNEYWVMLAEKLLNKYDYEIDREIRTLELLKLRFGESSMHGCEIMLKDIADSKRINSNIKASVASSVAHLSASRAMLQPAFPGSSAPSGSALSSSSSSSSTSLTRNAEHGSRLAALVARARGVFSQPGPDIATPSTHIEEKPKHEMELSLESLDATIVSSLFWPPFQSETIKVPDAIDGLLEDYAQRYHALKAPRKLQWRKHLGIVKLELQFQDRSAQFVVSPIHASIIMHFENRSCWASSDLASAVEVPVPTLRRRIMLWINQGVLVESIGDKKGEPYYTVVENIGEMGSAGVAIASKPGDSAVALYGEEEGESAVASTEEQWHQEMTVYESYVIGMLTNLEALPIDRIHNMLKMFVSDPPYDKTLQQLQAFLARLVSEEKLEIRDGVYRRRQP